MSDFTKGEGGKIVIKFNRPLVGDVSGSKPAFTISGYEPRWIGDTPQLKVYAVESVTRYRMQTVNITDSKCYGTVSGTSLTGTITVKDGDYILATVTHRSALTLPDGWTKLYESNAFGDSGVQKMVFAYMQATEDDVISLTVTQSSANRMFLNLISVSGISGIETTEYEVLKTESVASVSVPDKQEGEILIWGCSAYLWKSSSPYGYWTTSPSDLTMVSLPDTAAERTQQANFIDLGSGAATGREFIPNAPAGTPCVVNAVKLIPINDIGELQDTILLTMAVTGRFNNAVGDITVEYDATKGTLAGIGGAVSSFIRSFTPEELVPKGNPAPVEHISATFNNYSIIITKINFISTTNQEYIGAAIDNYQINLINIEDINP